MYCKKCGAAVTGRFCCCCGERVRTNAEEIKRETRRLRNQFKDACIEKYDYPYVNYCHMAEACWNAAEVRSSEKIYKLCGRYVHLFDHEPTEAFKMLADIYDDATFMFKMLVAAIETKEAIREGRDYVKRTID